MQMHGASQAGSVWGKVSFEIDEDTATIAVDAARNAGNRAEIVACIRSQQTRLISGAENACHELSTECLSWLLARFSAAMNSGGKVTPEERQARFN